MRGIISGRGTAGESRGVKQGERGREEANRLRVRGKQVESKRKNGKGKR